MPQDPQSNVLKIPESHPPRRRIPEFHTPRTLESQSPRVTSPQNEFSFFFLFLSPFAGFLCSFLLFLSPFPPFPPFSGNPTISSATAESGRPESQSHSAPECIFLLFLDFLFLFLDFLFLSFYFLILFLLFRLLAELLPFRPQL